MPLDPVALLSFRRLIALLPLALGLFLASAAHAGERVVLQLRHTHQFQFAGYYAALEKGYYRDAGLEVQILEGAGRDVPEREVLEGRAQFGIGSSALLLSRMAGKPVVVLGVVFQHSPYAIAMRRYGEQPDLRRLAGGRIMLGRLDDDLKRPNEVVAYLRREGIVPEQLQRLEHSYDPMDLVHGRVDAMLVYTTNEPDYLDRAGFAYDLYNPRAAGIDFYGDNLFTSEQEVQDHPERVKQFRAASLRGWQYAMSHPEEMADLILAKYSRRHDRQHLLHEARQMVPLVQPVLVEMGYMNPARWQHIASVYTTLGLLAPGASFDGFLYNADAAMDLPWLYRILAGVGLLVLVGAVVHVLLLARERRRAADAIRAGEERFRTMFEASPMGIALIDAASGAFTDVNPRYREIAGRSAEAFAQHTWPDFMHPDDVGVWRSEMQRLMSGAVREFRTTIRLIRADGSTVWVEASVVPLAPPRGGPRMKLCMIEDVTDQKENEALIWQQANFDTLTQLPNRRMFLDRLQHDIVKSRRDGSRIAILFIDLDHFKEVNDTLGHQQGDVLLVDAARRIAACVRESDTVARLGGDEFTVILTELTETRCVDGIAQNIIDSLLAPFQLGQEQAFVSASIGITLYPDDAVSVGDLLKHADQAMYVAKGAGRNRFSYFTPALQVAAQNRMRLTNDLRSAVKGDQLKLYFQPIVHLKTGRVVKAEALLRWQHPQRGLVSPLEFIPLAESSGLIVDIGQWVFNEAVRWVQRWRRDIHPEFQVSLNQSPVEFQREGGSYDVWLRTLREMDMPGQAIVVEITEGLLLDASTMVTDKLLQLRDGGIQVALDDFGTGYSSLSYLNKFDIDYLKIDRSFVSNLAPESSDMALSEAIIVMAHKLGLHVIAEGVETASQRDLLAAANCDFGQGYLFGKPIPAEEFDAFLADRLAIG
ncbi:EAL domain-containing protein [Pseudoduganella lurida]|uniref:EAL domain-containing protein n=1 Tax=Pseudoduganella lurida TaxID=1036180 RepID=UPI0027D98EDA|nr:EAL domain-containing protein [Pseudoduganella lurida]